MHTWTKTFALGLAGAMLIALLGVGTATAQDPEPRTTVGWGLSMYNFSPFVEGIGEESAEEAGLGSSLGALLFVHHWINPRIGLQADGAYSRPELTLPNQTASLDLWTVSAGLTLRPLGAPRPVAPYAMASAGLISYGLGGPSLRMEEEDLILDTDRTEQFMFQFGGGLDIALFEMREYDVVGLRVEAASMLVSGRPFRLDEAADEGGHNHLRITIGLHTSLPRN